MNPSSNKALPCAVFGHNFVKTKTNTDQTLQLKCTHCNHTVNTDASGNFEDLSIRNKNIQSSLRKLFHLNMRVAKFDFS